MLTPQEFKDARLKLGFSQNGLAAEWGMGLNGGRTIRKWEHSERPMNPVAAYCLALMSDTRPDIREIGNQDRQG